MFVSAIMMMISSHEIGTSCS